MLFNIRLVSNLDFSKIRSTSIAANSLDAFLVSDLGFGAVSLYITELLDSVLYSSILCLFVLAELSVLLS